MSRRSLLRIVLAAIGVVVWAFGLWRFAGGQETEGGVLILVGGLVMVIAASGGWSQFWEGVANWLYGLRH